MSDEACSLGAAATRMTMVTIDDKMEEILNMKQNNTSNEDFVRIMTKEIKVYEKYGGDFLWTTFHSTNLSMQATKKHITQANKKHITRAENKRSCSFYLRYSSSSYSTRRSHWEGPQTLKKDP